MRNGKRIQSFQDRLEWAREVGNLSKADLSRWFDRPYSTVNSWMKGHKPSGPPGDVRETMATMLQIEEAIRQKLLPLHRVSITKRWELLRKIQEKMKRNVSRRRKPMKKPKYEGSPADRAKDKREMAKRGMSEKAWERSAADKRMDRAGQKKLDKKR